MPPRAAFRLFNSPLAFRSSLRQQIQRRRVTTSEGINVEPQSKLVQFYHSPVGPKTVHFWAPVMKWAIVIAGISDLARPAESLSLTQNGALMATGLIWTRWCLIIKPKNVLLATVNFFLFCVGGTQVTRILMHQSAAKKLLEEDKASAEKLLK